MHREIEGQPPGEARQQERLAANPTIFYGKGLPKPGNSPEYCGAVATEKKD